MKKIITCVFAAFLAATALWAQTPEEIIARMDKETERFDPEGFSMVMEIKIPILGTIATKVNILGDKYKMVADVKGETSIHWSDGVTDWDYESADNEITITNAKPSQETEAESNVKMLKGVTDGYDVRLQKETDAAWYFRCTKSKTNTNKDDPRTMDLVVAKGTYLPISLKASMKGVTVTLRDFVVGMTEADVTFDASQYPNVKITDKR